MIFFTADLHLQHKLMKDLRGFSSVDEMDECIISHYNDRVKPSDRVYILGDIGFANKSTMGTLVGKVKQLHGQKYLIRGNHDHNALLRSCRNEFVWIKDFFELKTKIVDNKNTDGIRYTKRISLMHYAMMTWPSSHRDTWHLFGHTHGSLTGQKFSFDVGIDTYPAATLSLDTKNRDHKERFFPYSLDEICDMMYRNKE